MQLLIHVPHCFICGCGLASGLFSHGYIMAEFVAVQQTLVTWDMTVERGQSHICVFQTLPVFSFSTNKEQPPAVASASELYVPK